MGMKTDAAVFVGVLAGSEPKLANLFNRLAMHRESPLTARAYSVFDT